MATKRRATSTLNWCGTAWAYNTLIRWDTSRVVVVVLLVRPAVHPLLVWQPSSPSEDSLLVLRGSLNSHSLYVLYIVYIACRHIWVLVVRMWIQQRHAWSVLYSIRVREGGLPFTCGCNSWWTRSKWGLLCVCEWRAKPQIAATEHHAKKTTSSCVHIYRRRIVLLPNDFWFYYLLWFCMRRLFFFVCVYSFGKDYICWLGSILPMLVW